MRVIGSRGSTDMNRSKDWIRNWESVRASVASLELIYTSIFGVFCLVEGESVVNHAKL